MAIRQPIIAVMGHVDHGKTSLLDAVRGSIVAKGEAGLITQHIGASEVPISDIKCFCNKSVCFITDKVRIPGLLFIDTPGHAAFTTLRKRGGAISDIGILIVDINEGFQPQTIESLTFLKEFKTPFIVALTKIDRIMGWNPQKDVPFAKSYDAQSERVQREFDEKFYTVLGQLSQHGFPGERCDRITDFTKQIVMVPISNHTREGIADLLMFLAGMSQKFLEKRLEITPGEGKGSILEVKEFKGLGKTIDVIIYDGEVRRSDWIVIGGNEIIVTKIKALLKPNPNSDMRVEKKFITVDSVSAASGVKISAPGLDNVIAGSPIRCVSDEKDVEKAKKELEREIEEVEFDTGTSGVIVRADTLGSLEAMIKLMKENEIPIRRAKVGTVSKTDVMESTAMEDPMIFAFNVPIPEDIKLMVKDEGVQLFSSDIIYRIIEGYEEYKEQKARMKEEELLGSITSPARFRLLPGYVFRQCKPAVAGVEILAGTLKPGVKIRKQGTEEIIGTVKELRVQDENVKEAKSGERLAVSMDDVVIGRNVKEGDVLETYISKKDAKMIEKIKEKLRKDEAELFDEIKPKNVFGV
ncbi:MAG: translation initiation factor IF-2 [Candidatus Aenigmarchaeota archaeon]|nr:translation initiation factor IF-2 [Candidatus Aenigmarchaeota archaeon]